MAKPHGFTVATTPEMKARAKAPSITSGTAVDGRAELVRRERAGLRLEHACRRRLTKNVVGRRPRRARSSRSRRGRAGARTSPRPSWRRLSAPLGRVLRDHADDAHPVADRIVQRPRRSGISLRHGQAGAGPEVHDQRLAGQRAQATGCPVEGAGLDVRQLASPLTSVATGMPECSARCRARRREVAVPLRHARRATSRRRGRRRWPRPAIRRAGAGGPPDQGTGGRRGPRPRRWPARSGRAVLPGRRQVRRDRAPRRRPARVAGASVVVRAVACW